MSGQYFSQCSILYSNKADRPGGFPMKAPNANAVSLRVFVCVCVCLCVCCVCECFESVLVNFELGCLTELH